MFAGDDGTMQLLCCDLAALAIAVLYYSWRAYHQARLRREQTLRERVAYLLWAVATETD
jgi:hypothetical protein